MSGKELNPRKRDLNSALSRQQEEIVLSWKPKRQQNPHELGVQQERSEGEEEPPTKRSSQIFDRKRPYLRITSDSEDFLATLRQQGIEYATDARPWYTSLQVNNEDIHQTLYFLRKNYERDAHGVF